MYNTGEALRNEDLVDPNSGHLSQLSKRVVHLMGISMSSAPKFSEDRFILRTPLAKCCGWSSPPTTCWKVFKSICNGSNEGSAILSYLSANGKAR
ncbi:hypothetical protein IFM89_002847 [Coptis chinensis]|uniref:Uncharacterized protein n=1 Tax=Coptis chinensis TaxID=261450 RepID=A0A835H3W4_9MAGN|nr:hypothetical protein IFM89_002847 [Coptis chinensis]